MVGAARLAAEPGAALHLPRAERQIGRSWQRGKIAPDGCFQAVIVLRWDVSRGAFCVLTSYPEVAR